MFESARIDDGLHDPGSFHSGEPDLDSWLRNHAGNSEVKRITRTFVWCNEGSRNVVAYYSLMGHKIVREGLPKNLAHGSPSEVPAVLLARLALDETLQGRGLGGVLLVDALRRIVAATEIVGARFVVVDAIHERAARFYEHCFYEHYGFVRLPGSNRLYRKVSAVKSDLH